MTVISYMTGDERSYGRRGRQGEGLGNWLIIVILGVEGW